MKKWKFLESKLFRNAEGAKSSGQEGAAPAQLF